MVRRSRACTYGRAGRARVNQKLTVRPAGTFTARRARTSLGRPSARSVTGPRQPPTAFDGQPMRTLKRRPPTSSVDTPLILPSGPVPARVTLIVIVAGRPSEAPSEPE